jgi:3-oxoacyl-[acyl-carrier protein] reductase
MTKSIAEELGEFNIRANSIAPGITETDMISTMTEEIIHQTIDRTQLRRIGKAEEIAKAVVYLISDCSSYITGQTIRVDGGLK